LLLKFEFRTLLACSSPGRFEKMNNPDICSVTCLYFNLSFTDRGSAVPK